MNLPPQSSVRDPVRVLIFGTGRFLRGFACDILQQARDEGRFNGGAVMVQSTGSGRARALNESGGRFGLAERGVERGRRVDRARWIDVVSGCVALPGEWDELRRLAVSEAVRCVVSNVTERGLADGETAGSAPRDGPPATFAGRLTALLHERYRALGDAGELVVLPCELVDRNGEVVRGLVHRTRERWDLDSGFGDWLDRKVAFSSTLVDRIVTEPATEEMRRTLEARLGRPDPMLTVCEPFRLWAIESPRTASGAWAAVRGWLEATEGVRVVPDIGPIAERKIRLLNGTHTSCAQVAMMLGHAMVREFAADRRGGAFLRRALLDEALRVRLTAGAGNEDEAFARGLFDRFANPFLDHRWADIAAGSMNKARVRVLPTISEGAALGVPTPAMALGVAALLAFGDIGRIGLSGSAPIEDSELRALSACWAAAPAAPDACAAQVVERAFSPEGPLGGDGGSGVGGRVKDALAVLLARGPVPAVDASIRAG